MEQKHFDEKRFDILIRVANMTGNYHIEEIGKNISTIADIVLKQACFRSYPDEWRSEMRSVAYEYMMDALKNVDTTKGRTFTYLFGIATRACGRHVGRLKGKTVPLPDVEFTDGESLLGGALPVVKYNKENPCNRIKKAVLLKNVINRAVETVIETFNIKQIDALISSARANREAIC